MKPPQTHASDDGWTSVRVAAAFGGLRFLPWWWGTSTNSANPLLEIGPTGIRYRVLLLREVKYSGIELLDVRTAWRTVNLCFRFHDAVGTFSANVRTLEEAARALKLMEGRVPFSARARRIGQQTQGAG